MQEVERMKTLIGYAPLRGKKYLNWGKKSDSENVLPLPMNSPSFTLIEFVLVQNYSETQFKQTWL
jgi:hypothetical protein